MAISIKSIGGSLNEIPKVTNLVANNVGGGVVNIEYRVEDVERTICRHYLYLNTQKTEITKAVGYESTTNVYKYTVRNVPNEYTIQVGASDGLDEGLSEAIHHGGDTGGGGGGEITPPEPPPPARNEIYGVRVMLNNSNPETSVSYINDAHGVLPATSTSLGGWANKYPFNKVRLVGMKNGLVTKEVNPTNKTFYKDGTPIPADVDVMSEIPKFYWKASQIANGFEVNISAKKLEGYDCYAHKVGGVEKDFIHIGAYLGSVDGGRLRSKSGVVPTTSTSMSVFRSYAQANGQGYQQWNWYSFLACQYLYLIAYKNLNSQSALGMGVSTPPKVATGGTNTKGLVYGESNNYSVPICFLGIEDLWGNVCQWVDGMYFDGTNIMVCPDNKNFNNYRNGFVSVGNVSYLRSGRISKVVGTSQGGFFPTETAGSDYTYFCDYGYAHQGYWGVSGGSFSDGTSNGMFYLYVAWGATESDSTIGARLCFLG